MSILDEDEEYSCPCEKVAVNSKDDPLVAWCRAGHPVDADGRPAVPVRDAPLLNELSQRVNVLVAYRRARAHTRRAFDTHERCGCGQVEMASMEDVAKIDTDTIRTELWVLEALEDLIQERTRKP